ncbi:MAG TPA: riboflavin biosynthesis protein RibF [Bacteroidales bacterium]|nr:riboflavin biosynthesis protein RibF [Bacteroidales bacterium]
MVIHYGYETLKLVNPVVTLGIFDGVHLGHRAIISRLLSCAEEIKGESVVITFDPHPRLVLDSKSGKPTFLSTMDEKEKLLAGTGIDHLVIIQFTAGFSRMTASDFVKNILADKIGTRRLIIGYDHHFGHGGTGDYYSIREYAGNMGIIVEQIKGLRSEGVVISSSEIREALINGNLDDANRWLGYNYSFRGIVVRGKKIGRKLGFPTANLEPGDKNKLIPSSGVYAVEVRAGEMTMPGMLSIGTNPTVNRESGVRSVEVHIFDFDGEIYGSELEIIFRRRLRDEKRFDTTDELVRQIRIDMDNALKALG